MKKYLFAVLVLTAPSLSPAADWQCYKVAYHQGRIMNVDYSADALVQVIAANETVDDYVAAFTGTQICLKGRLLPGSGQVGGVANFLTYAAQ